MGDYFKRNFRIGFIIVLGSFLVAIFLIGWLGRTTRSLAEDVSSKRYLANQQLGITETIALLQRDKNNSLDYIERAKFLIPARDELFEFSNWLSRQAATLEVGIDFKFDGSEIEPQDDSLGYAGFLLTLNGTADSLTSFIENLELKSTRFLLEFGTFSLSEKGGKYQMSLRGQVFFRE